MSLVLLAASAAAAEFLATQEFADPPSHNNGTLPPPSKHDAFTECAHSGLCRLGVLAGVVLCVIAIVCNIIRGSRSRVKGELDNDGDAEKTALLNGDEAHAVQEYIGHEDLWPGPQTWLKMTAQQRGRVMAKVVCATTSILRGPNAAERAKELNEWVRGEHGVQCKQLERVKVGLDQVLCAMEPEQLEQEVGSIWPLQSRWRRMANCQRAQVYAEYMKTRLFRRRHIRKYVKWVRERGFLLNLVVVAASEAEKAIRNILSSIPVAYSEAKLDSILANVDGLDDSGSEEPTPTSKKKTPTTVPELSVTAATPLDSDKHLPDDGFPCNAGSLSLFAHFMRLAAEGEAEDIFLSNSISPNTSNAVLPLESPQHTPRLSQPSQNHLHPDSVSSTPPGRVFLPSQDEWAVGVNDDAPATTDTTPPCGALTPPVLPPPVENPHI